MHVGFVCVSLLATCCLVGGVCVCVPASDLPVESCMWGLCVSLPATCQSSLVGGVCVCVPAGDLPVESCRWGLFVSPCWRLAVL